MPPERFGIVEGDVMGALGRLGCGSASQRSCGIVEAERAGHVGGGDEHRQPASVELLDVRAPVRRARPRRRAPRKTMSSARRRATSAVRVARLLGRLPLLLLLDRVLALLLARPAPRRRRDSPRHSASFTASWWRSQRSPTRWISASCVSSSSPRSNKPTVDQGRALVALRRDGVDAADPGRAPRADAQGALAHLLGREAEDLRRLVGVALRLGRLDRRAPATGRGDRSARPAGRRSRSGSRRGHGRRPGLHGQQGRVLRHRQRMEDELPAVRLTRRAVVGKRGEARPREQSLDHRHGHRDVVRRGRR